MSDNNLKGAGERDSLIEKAVESVLNTAVVGSARMTGGEVNDTYKVEKEDRAFVVKVFRRDWPEKDRGESEGRSVMGRIGIESQDNIILCESKQTSTRR